MSTPSNYLDYDKYSDLLIKGEKHEVTEKLEHDAEGLAGAIKTRDNLLQLLDDHINTVKTSLDRLPQTRLTELKVELQDKLDNFDPLLYTQLQQDPNNAGLSSTEILAKALYTGKGEPTPEQMELLHYHRLVALSEKTKITKGELAKDDSVLSEALEKANILIDIYKASVLDTVAIRNHDWNVGVNRKDELGALNANMALADTELDVLTIGLGIYSFYKLATKPKIGLEDKLTMGLIGVNILNTCLKMPNDIVESVKLFGAHISAVAETNMAHVALGAGIFSVVVGAISLGVSLWQFNKYSNQLDTEKDNQTKLITNFLGKHKNASALKPETRDVLKNLEQIQQKFYSDKVPYQTTNSEGKQETKYTDLNSNMRRQILDRMEKGELSFEQLDKMEQEGKVSSYYIASARALRVVYEQEHLFKQIITGDLTDADIKEIIENKENLYHPDYVKSIKDISSALEDIQKNDPEAYASFKLQMLTSKLNIIDLENKKARGIRNIVFSSIALGLAVMALAFPPSAIIVLPLAACIAIGKAIFERFFKSPKEKEQVNQVMEAVEQQSHKMASKIAGSPTPTAVAAKPQDVKPDTKVQPQDANPEEKKASAEHDTAAVKKADSSAPSDLDAKVANFEAHNASQAEALDILANPKNAAEIHASHTHQQLPSESTATVAQAANEDDDKREERDDGESEGAHNTM
jgi:hypothetical protein